MRKQSRRWILSFGLFVAAFSLIGCAGGDETPSDTDTSTDGDSHPCPGVITFPDSNLEAVIRVAIDKPTGDIVYEDLTEVTDLNAVSKSISDLAKIECLDKLTNLSLYLNQISNLSPLGNLTSLTELNLSFNQISDLTPLANLTGLTELDLSNNQISDLSPLANLTNLTELLLQTNQISDLSPLLDNTGLGDDDYVYVSDNPLNCDDAAILQQISALEDRGVYLADDCT